jgi:CBS domain-containing protein
MQVSEILQSKGDRIIDVQPAAKVLDVAETLRHEGVGAALVRDRDGALLGIISERDIVRRLAEDGEVTLGRSAADLMSTTVVTCQPANRIEEVMEQMLSEQIRHLPVCEDGRLVGIVSIGDVVKCALEDLRWREEVLCKHVVTAAGWSTDEDPEDD